MVSPREAGWVRQHVETEVVGVAGEEDGVERGELESPLSENFPEGFRGKMGRFRNRWVVFRAVLMWRRLELVADFFSYRQQFVIFIYCGAMVKLVQMHDERGDIGGFLAYLRNAPSHYFVDDHSPVHWPHSEKSFEQGVGHS